MKKIYTILLTLLSIGIQASDKNQKENSPKAQMEARKARIRKEGSDKSRSKLQPLESNSSTIYTMTMLQSKMKQEEEEQLQELMKTFTQEFDTKIPEIRKELDKLSATSAKQNQDLDEAHKSLHELAISNQQSNKQLDENNKSLHELAISNQQSNKSLHELAISNQQSNKSLHELAISNQQSNKQLDMIFRDFDDIRQQVEKCKEIAEENQKIVQETLQEFLENHQLPVVNNTNKPRPNNNMTKQDQPTPKQRIAALFFGTIIGTLIGTYLTK